MARDNFFVKAVLVKKAKDEAHTTVKINISNIDAILDHNGGSLVVLSSGLQYAVVEAPEYFIKSGAAYGIVREV